jgi:hypothetical protein
MVQGDRAPALLGPMSPEMRVEIMQDLQTRYGPTCGLHTMDVQSDGPERVTVTVKRNEQKGDRTA